jgi:hypothetical protein
MKAKASVSPANFLHELGWIFLKEEHRSKGQMRLLIKTLLRVDAIGGVFAATRFSNDRMQRILLHHKFVRHGEAYQSGNTLAKRLSSSFGLNQTRLRRPM